MLRCSIFAGVLVLTSSLSFCHGQDRTSDPAPESTAEPSEQQPALLQQLGDKIDDVMKQSRDLINPPESESGGNDSQPTADAGEQRTMRALPDYGGSTAADSDSVGSRAGGSGMATAGGSAPEPTRFESEASGAEASDAASPRSVTPSAATGAGSLSAEARSTESDSGGETSSPAASSPSAAMASSPSYTPSASSQFHAETPDYTPSASSQFHAGTPDYTPSANSQYSTAPAEEAPSSTDETPSSDADSSSGDTSSDDSSM